MPRYELAGDTWQIEQTDEQLAITSAGKTTIRKFRTPEQAAVQLVKLVDERVAAGYLPTLGPRHAALEAAIATIRSPMRCTRTGCRARAIRAAR